MFESLENSRNSAEISGKARGLLFLKEAGAALPEALVVASSWLDSWSRALPSWAVAIEEWRGWDGQEECPALRKLEREILDSSVPEDWSKEFARARVELGGGELIFRSSMSAEDSAVDSFAGAYKSIRVAEDCTPDVAWSALRDVVSSAFSREAAHRLLSAGQDPSRFRPGVVLQKFIHGKLSGVCFSRSENHPGAVVEWTRGDGEALVQGRAQSSVYRSVDGEPPEEIASFVEEILNNAERLERPLLSAVDIEWTWDGSRLWFLQVRSIAGEIFRDPLSRAGRHWTRELSQERFPEPVTPLGWSVIEDLIESNFESLRRDLGVILDSSSPMAIRHHAYIYSDPEFFRYPGRIRIRFLKFLNPLGPYFWKGLGAVFSYLFRRARGVSNRISAAHFKLECTWCLLGPTASRISGSWQKHVSRTQERLAALAIDGIEKPAEILGAMAQLREISVEFLEPDLMIYLVKDSMHRALRGFWQSQGLSADRLDAGLASFSGNRSLRMGAEWQDVAQKILLDPGCSRFLELLEGGSDEAGGALKPEAAAAWKEFLQDNGHCRTSWDIALPSWGERPAQLAPLLKSLISSGRANKKLESSAIGLNAAETKSVGQYVTVLQDFMRMDEELRFLSGMLLSPSRKVVLAAGEFLAKKQFVLSPEDVFFLSLEELKATLMSPGLNLKTLLRRRRSEWQRQQAHAPPEQIPPREQVSHSLASADWMGLPVSPGVARGPAFFVEHLGDARAVPAGAILVTSAPNPAFVPLYPLISGILTRSGGPLSHGFVAAREYRLPAVSCVATPEKKIKPGQWLEINGESGQIRLLEGPVQ